MGGWAVCPQREDCEQCSIKLAAIILCLACVSWQLLAWLGVCVCLGGYLFRRMPPIWELTAVLSASSESFSQLPLSQKKVFTHSH